MPDMNRIPLTHEPQRDHRALARPTYTGRVCRAILTLAYTHFIPCHFYKT